MTNSTFRYIWDRLPDPSSLEHSLVNIVADYNAWKHFCVDSKHLSCKSGIFEEWLGPEVYRQLRDAWLGDCSVEERNRRLAQAGKAMDGEIRRAMNAPIVLVFVCSGVNGGQPSEQWRLPLHNGVRMFAKRLKKHAILVTCFPPDAVSRALISTHRWLLEISNAVETYADLRNRGFQLPSPEKEITKRVDGRKIVHKNIRFHEPANWGFVDDSPGARWSPPIHYPAAGTSFRLVPRANM